MFHFLFALPAYERTSGLNDVRKEYQATTLHRRESAPEDSLRQSEDEMRITAQNIFGKGVTHIGIGCRA